VGPYVLKTILKGVLPCAFEIYTKPCLEDT